MFILLCHWAARSHLCHYYSATLWDSPTFTSGFSVSPFLPYLTSTPLLMGPPPDIRICPHLASSTAPLFLSPSCSYSHTLVEQLSSSQTANLALPLAAFSSTSHTPLVRLNWLFSFAESFSPSVSISPIYQTPPGFTSLSVSPNPAVISVIPTQYPLQVLTFFLWTICLSRTQLQLDLPVPLHSLLSPAEGPPIAWLLVP